MRRGHGIAVRFPGLYVVHHNLPGKIVEWRAWPQQHVLFIPLQGEITILLRSGSLVGGPEGLDFVESPLPSLRDDGAWTAAGEATS